MVFDVVRAKTAQEPDSGGRGIELGQLVLLYSLPVPRRRGVDGRRFEYGGRHTVAEGAVNDVTEGFRKRSKGKEGDGGDRHTSDL